MQNERRAAIRSEAKRLEKYFIDSGALLLEADSLLSAETLLIYTVKILELVRMSLMTQ